MKIPALLATILLLASIAAYAGITYDVKQKKLDKPVGDIITAAPTEVVADAEKPAEPTKKEKLPVYVVPTQPDKLYVGVPPTQPYVEITNGVKNEGNGTVNVYNNNQQQEQVSTPPPTTAPAIPQTPLEKALAIVHSWDTNGTAEYYGDNKIRVYAFNGKSLTVDLVGDWETTLNINLRKIK